MRRVALIGISTMACLILPVGCDMFQEKVATSSDGAKETFEGTTELIKRNSQPVVLPGDGKSRVLVSPRLQGRILTVKVGSVESTGLVNTSAILKGETDPHFNNFGGMDRFWLGPEGGQFGLYFPPGADFNRQTWKVPPAFDAGPYPVSSSDSSKVVMARDMEVANYRGTKFTVHVDREVGVLKGQNLPSELGVTLPADVQYAGAYSVNTIMNSGNEEWRLESGLIGIWILGQFNPSDSTIIIGPFKPGSDAELGPAFNDDYFGKVSVDAPDRLKVLGNAVLFRADARRVGKFGISQQRTTGLAGSFDFEKSLLTIVKFDVPQTAERYGNSSWVKIQPEPFKGDVLQSYNNGVEGKPGELAEVPFYEIESTSPVRPLKPGESLRHRHMTHHFQGDIQKLAPIAKQLLGVDLAAVKQAMLR